MSPGAEPGSTRRTGCRRRSATDRRAVGRSIALDHHGGAGARDAGALRCARAP
jgi:hypothetical protein